MKEDNQFVIEGPEPFKTWKLFTVGKLIYNNLLVNPSDAQAMIDAITGESISYKEILVQTCSLAESLQRSGYGKGTVISLSSENNLQFFIPVIAALYVGAVIAPINPHYVSQEILHSLNLYEPRIVFCSYDVHKKYVNLRDTIKTNLLERIIVIDRAVIECDPGSIVETMDVFISRSLGNVRLSRFLTAEFDPKEQVAFILSSSGTTGVPKGVVHTHANIMFTYFYSLDSRYLRSIKCLLGVLPFFHSYGLVTNLVSLIKGEQIVVLKRFEEKAFLKAIQDYKISTLMLAPPLILFLAKSPLVDQYDLSSVEEIVSGAAPLSKETEEAVKERLKIKYVRQGYGLTEATLAVLIMVVGESRFGSSGKVVTYMQCKVRDPETGKSLGPNQVGEICLKGPMIMKGYYKNPKATKEIFTSDGWLLTGDLGYYDDDNFFFIVDRLKELIKYKGFQVAPAELEAIVLTHPKVTDVGVVGQPKGDVGELPLAFVVKKPNEKLSEKEIQDYVAERVSSQKRLRGGVVFLKAIPKNPSGKILRRELRIMAKDLRSKL